jgi:hypothetical protein
VWGSGESCIAIDRELHTVGLQYPFTLSSALRHDSAVTVFNQTGTPWALK